MPSINKVMLIGRLGKDPELRHTGSGQAVANFSLATEESYKDKSGERQKKTEWHQIVVWGDLAENVVAKYLRKGDLVFLEGKLQTRSWEDKEGNKKYVTEVNVFNIQSLTPPPASDSSNRPLEGRPAQSTGQTTARPAQQSRPPQQSRPASRPAPPAPDEISDEDIPF